MRRFFVLSFLAAATALGVWYGLRGASLRTSNATVAALLPKETLAFVYLPDFKRSRAQWHTTDLYQLWREPALQDFLRKPLSRLPKTDETRQKMQEMEALDLKDAFVALTAFERRQPIVVGGFRFNGSTADAEKVIGPWRARLRESLPAAKHETVAYEGHQVEIVNNDVTTAATVYAGDWFFVSNNVVSLKAVLDRADKRINDRGTTLTADEDFAAATQHMPSSYAAFGYARLDQLMQKLATQLSPGTEKDKPISALRQIRSVAGATAFAEGKIRDVFFVAMPKLEGGDELKRSSLSLATRESFLYLASILNFPKQMGPADPHPATPGGVSAVWQRFLAAAAGHGITAEDWSGAFGDEWNVIGEWPEKARLPDLFATVALKDTAKAKKIVATLTASAPEDEPWTASEKDGVQYYSQPRLNPMVRVAPTIALSSQLLVAGLDLASVEEVIKRGPAGASGLAGSDRFKATEKWVPAAKQSFTYVDLALLYERLDAALRPMLVMAALMPKISETVDLGKLPAAEVITKHLGPLVISQSYERDGYVTEAIGPVSVLQAALGVIGATGAGASFYPGLIPESPGSPPATNDASPAPSPGEPAPVPNETPQAPTPPGESATPKAAPYAIDPS